MENNGKKMISTFTAEELAELAEYDKRVDGGADDYPLTKEQEKVAKQYKNIGEKTKKKPFVPNLPKKEKKANTEKQALINALVAGLPEEASEPNIVNNERQFEFTYNGTLYRVVLSAPRK